MLFAGCDFSSPPPRQAPAAPLPATIKVINLSPIAWRIVIAGSSEKNPSRQIEIAALGSVPFTVPAGAYTVTQTALADLPPAAASRRFSVTFAPGEFYRWPLATVLTGPAEPAP